MAAQEARLPTGSECGIEAMTPAEKLARAVLLDYEETDLSDEEFSEQMKALLGDDSIKAFCDTARATLAWLHVSEMS